jgi:hypothetical protein
MNRKITLIVLLAFCLMTVTMAFATNPMWKLVVKVRGTVENQYQGSQEWHMIWQSRMLKDGDSARTGRDSRANIRLADNSVITLGENTQVQMSQFQLQKESRLTKINLVFGKVRSRVGRFTGKDSKFEVKTPNAVLAARGTEFLVEYGTPEKQGDASNGTTKVMVFENSVDITSGGTTTTVSEGSSAFVNPDGSVTMNPSGYTALPAGTGKGVDQDLMEYDPNLIGNEKEYPREPYVAGEGGAFTGPQPGIVPPPGNTGTITIILHPPVMPY